MDDGFAVDECYGFNFDGLKTVDVGFVQGDFSDNSVV